MLLCLTLTVCPLPPSAQEVVNVYNWEDYIAPEAVLDPSSPRRRASSVNYMCFTTNEDMIVSGPRRTPVRIDVMLPVRLHASSA